MERASARTAAEQGNEHMKGMLAAMSDINNKSGEIQKIIKEHTGKKGVEDVYFTSFVMQ